LRRPVAICATYSSFFFLRSDRRAVVFFAGDFAVVAFAELFADVDFAVDLAVVFFAVVAFAELFAVDLAVVFAARLAVVFFAADLAAVRSPVEGSLSEREAAFGSGAAAARGARTGRPSHLGTSPSLSGCGF
jgi:hypothetical protein